ncbi:MAG: ATP-binding protein [Gallionellaceae bacterium]
MRFRTKTILGVAVIELALLAVLVGSALSNLRESSETELTQRVRLGAQLLAAASKDALISQDLATLDSLVSEAISTGQIDRIRIVDFSGRVLAEHGDGKVMSHHFHQVEQVSQVTNGYYDWSAPVMAGGIKHGEVQLTVSLAPLHILLDSAKRWAAGIAGLEMLLVAIFSWLLGSFLVKQLSELREATRHFALGNFEYRVNVAGSDELADTALAFNRMAQQIGENHQQLQIENDARLKAQMLAELAKNQADDRNEQLNGIFALSPDGFVSFDANRCVKYASPAFTKLTGLEKRDMVGMSEAAFTERLLKQCSQGLGFPGFEKLRASALKNEEQGMVTRHVFETDIPEKRVLEVGLRESQSKSVSQILYFRDITHETEVERMKSEFLSTAAHELRTPMSSIYGYSEILLAQEFSEEERREFLQIIYTQSELMISIINELLDLARIEDRGGKDFVMVPLVLTDVLEEVVASYKTPNNRPRPTIAHLPEPVFIFADRYKMLQALMNIISNAYKYSAAPGAVSIEVVREQSVQPSAVEMVGIRIADQGMGMTPEQLARVFERFYRADSSGKIPGTGLGMSIVQEIIEQHGGQVKVESTQGVGTSVTIWMPQHLDNNDAAIGNKNENKA